MEVSETCTLCLSRLFSLLRLDKGESVSLHSSLEAPPARLPPLFKFKLGLEDVNMFTLSSVAGENGEKAFKVSIAYSVLVGKNCLHFLH